jgi:LCP family protein required for cell wall assembly
MSPSEERLRALGSEIDRSSAPQAPVQGGAGGADTAGKVPNEQALLALGEQIDRSQGRPPAKRGRSEHKSRRRLFRRWGLIGLAFIVLLVAGGAGFAYYEVHDLNREEVRGLSSPFTSGKEAGTENILMVGSTSRCALTQQNAAYGLCSEGVDGVNSDVIMILHADPTHHRLALLSIPRDLFIPNARAEGANKIDAGLVEGISQVVAAVEEDFGIPIQHAVSLNFDQFANIVDALGGIDMSFPESVFDAESGLNVQAAACVHLNGTQALSVVRARHLQYKGAGVTATYAQDWPQETLSDLARIRRDHEFLRVLASAVAKTDLENPVTDFGLINSVKADLTFDQSWSVNDMVDLVLDFHSININSVPQLTLPVAVVNDPDGDDGSLNYEGGSYGDVEFPAQTQDQSTIDEVLGINSDTNSMTGQPLPAPSSVTVSVMNGTGVADQAGDTKSALSALGFDTLGVGDTTPVGDVSETVVYYGSRSAADVAAAEAVSRAMSGSVVMAYDPSQVKDGAEVTVVTGSQFAVESPAAAPTGTTAATSQTTTNTTAPSSGAIATPSPSTMSLQPWDPRACAAGAVVTAPKANPTY